MTSTSAAIAVFYVASSALAQAQDIGGKYTATGTDPAGSTYSGTAEITMIDENACKIKWNDGSEGICMLNGTALSIAYLIHGALGLGTYQVSADGSIAGTFIDTLHGGGIGKGGGIGNEKLVPIS